MPNRRIIDGKTTPERITEQLELLRDPAFEERVTVEEFARRVGISPHTFKHTYPGDAAEVRTLRDRERTKRRRRSPATRSQADVVDLAEAADVIAKLRQRNDRLDRELARAIDACEKADKRAAQAAEWEADNDRLRGIVTFLQQAIYRSVDVDRARAIFQEMEERVRADGESE